MALVQRRDARLEAVERNSTAICPPRPDPDLPYGMPLDWRSSVWTPAEISTQLVGVTVPSLPSQSAALNHQLHENFQGRVHGSNSLGAAPQPPAFTHTSSWDPPLMRMGAGFDGHRSSWEQSASQGPSSPSSPYEFDPILGRPRTSWDLPRPRIAPESCSNPSDWNYSDPYAYDPPFDRPLTSWDLPRPQIAPELCSNHSYSESYRGGGGYSNNYNDYYNNEPQAWTYNTYEPSPYNHVLQSMQYEPPQPTPCYNHVPQSVQYEPQPPAQYYAEPQQQPYYPPPPSHTHGQTTVTSPVMPSPLELHQSPPTASDAVRFEPTTFVAGVSSASSEMKELFQGPNQGDKLVEEATAETLDEQDRAANLELCDMINHEGFSSVDLIRGMKKRIMLESPRIQYLSLVLLESVAKNCEKAFSATAATKVKMDQKEAQGVAEKMKGRREPGSVIGSSAAGCVCALLSIYGVGGVALAPLWELERASAHSHFGWAFLLQAQEGAVLFGLIPNKKSEVGSGGKGLKLREVSRRSTIFGIYALEEVYKDFLYLHLEDKVILKGGGVDTLFIFII